jgi:hypothetical protein
MNWAWVCTTHCQEFGWLRIPWSSTPRAIACTSRLNMVAMVTGERSWNCSWKRGTAGSLAGCGGDDIVVTLVSRIRDSLNKRGRVSP